MEISQLIILEIRIRKVSGIFGYNVQTYRKKYALIFWVKIFWVKQKKTGGKQKKEILHTAMFATTTAKWVPSLGQVSATNKQEYSVNILVRITRELYIFTKIKKYLKVSSTLCMYTDRCYPFPFRIPLSYENE